MDSRDVTILHVEDDDLLSELVKTAFDHFGFRGDIITAGSVSAAVDLLSERERKKEPLSLIISDMQLPDGTGLDVIREVKTNPVWRMTPVIVLSNKDNESVVNDAYALGASSYMPKVPESKSLLEALESLYQFWLESAKLPRARSRDRFQETLERAIGLRTRTSEFYLNLAHASEKVREEMEFWLNRSLNEGNLANLLAFIRNNIREKDVPKSLIDKLASMQVEVQNALKKAEKLLQKAPSPSPEMAYQWVLELADALDDEVIAEVFGHLFPKSPAATIALRARAATQLKELALHIVERTKEAELRQKALSLLDLSQRLGSSD